MKISLVITSCCALLVRAIPLSATSSYSKALMTLDNRSTMSSRSPLHTKADVLNFILSLEHFQDSFYRQGLANFSQAQFAEAGFDEYFYTNLTEIASQENTHVTSLISDLRKLNVSPVAECEYNFNVTNPTIFVITASLIEAVSVSSYIGLLADLKGSAYLNVFSSVMAVEARHSSFIRAARGLTPFPSPYEVPTDIDESYTLVELFTVSCPEENPFHLRVPNHVRVLRTIARLLTFSCQNYSTLSSSYSNHGAIGQEVTFVTYGQDIKADSDKEPLYAAFLTLSGPVFAP